MLLLITTAYTRTLCCYKFSRFFDFFERFTVYKYNLGNILQLFSINTAPMHPYWTLWWSLIVTVFLTYTSIPCKIVISSVISQLDYKNTAVVFNRSEIDLPESSIFIWFLLNFINNGKKILIIHFKPAWTWSCATCSRWTCFNGGVGLDDLQSFLPAPSILWFCSVAMLQKIV